MIYPLTRSSYPRHREFQQRFLGDFERNRPRYVVAVDMVMSILGDGQADHTLYQEVQARLERGYSLEAVMTIRGRYGTYLGPQEMPPPPGGNIFVFRSILPEVSGPG